ncbi:metallophosphoesterase family protein [Leptolyngbya sp. AN02str]|uniref:metallophosphoesterase family protein n=1 Tax=Leptolyngbya sp. AN02str TaxID=3423363 RepID=UPI003D314737
MSLTRRRLFQLSGGVWGGMALTAMMGSCRTHQVTAHGEMSTASPANPTVTPAATSQASLTQDGVFNPPRGDVRIAIISDLNEAYGSTTYSTEVTRAIALLPGWQPDLVLCGGDMVAGQKRDLTQAQILAMWDGFDRAIAQPLRAANLPFGFTIGNHDASRAMANGRYSFQQERDLAAAYWNDPQHNPGLNFIDRYRFPFYYSFQQGDGFFLVWDASNGAAMAADDRAWVERSLGSPQAQQAAFRIVIGHLPLYAVAQNRDRPGEVMNNATELQLLLERYRVHTYMSGHHHAYYPGHIGQLNLLHTGALGGGPRQLLVGDRPARKTLTLVDMALTSASTTYTTFEIPTLRVVAMQDLPRIIPSHNGAVIRQDLPWAALSPQEKSTCLTHVSQVVCEATA